MSLKELLQNICTEIPTARNEQFADHSLANLIRNDLKAAIEEIVNANSNTYIVKSSPGAGNWANVISASILDPEITTTPQQGYYPVYLFRPDGSGVYLSLNQGTTNTTPQERERFKNFARQIPGTSEWGLVNIQLHATTQMGQGYEPPNIVAKFYPTEAIPSENTLKEDLLEVLKLYQKLKEANSNQMTIQEEISDYDTNSKHKTALPLNTILYGPPGTGKTFSTISQAIKILGASKLEEFQTQPPQSIEALKQAFPGQVEFVTFHQSFSYEDFVEGIQAKSNNGHINYDVEDGVFKNLCVNALFSCQNFENENHGSKPIGFTELYDQFLAIIKDKLPYELKTSSQKNIFINNVSTRETLHITHEGSEVKHSVGRRRIKKLYDIFNSKSQLEQVQNVQNEFREIIGGLNSTVYWAVLNKLLSLKDEIDNDFEKTELEDSFKDIDQKKKALADLENLDYNNKYPHVLIIDEINRGNISRIFGELITLIEPSKRAGNEEAISVQLPYSKESFSVPNNLYIIGTMNTADRSLALIDTALRRRFEFIEMMPKPTLLSRQKDYGKVFSIDLIKMLTVMNQRIEVLYDREHTIGHAFLMNLHSLNDLRRTFKNKILPLLEEYFFDDWQKIRLVLGAAADAFYEKVEWNENLFVGDEAPQAPTSYRRQTLENITIENFKAIYQGVNA